MSEIFTKDEGCNGKMVKNAESQRTAKSKDVYNSSWLRSTVKVSNLVAEE